VRTDFHCHAFAPHLIPVEVLQHRARVVLDRRGVRLDGQNHPPAVERMTAKMTANMDDRDASHLRNALEAVGVNHAVLVGLDWGLLGAATEETSLSAWLEWAQAVITRHDGFFSFVMGIDPRRPSSGDFARRALSEAWVAGIKLYPPAGFGADDECCNPIYEAAVDAGAFVMCHTGRQSFPFDLARGRLEQYSVVQRRHPDLRLILAHAGAPMWGEHAIEIAGGHMSTYLEVSGWHRLVAREPDRLRVLLARMWQELGPHRILYGSDYVSGPNFPAETAAMCQWKEFYEQAAQEHGIDLGASEQTAADLLGPSLEHYGMPKSVVGEQGP
jgi:uncharacterized protein